MILFFEEIHFLLQGRESLESLSVIRAALYKLFGFVVIEVYFYKLVFIGEGLALLLGQPELMQLVRVLGLVGVLEFVQSAPDELAQILVNLLRKVCLLFIDSGGSSLLGAGPNTCPFSCWTESLLFP